MNTTLTRSTCSYRPAVLLGDPVPRERPGGRGARALLEPRAARPWSASSRAIAAASASGSSGRHEHARRRAPRRSRGSRPRRTAPSPCRTRARRTARPTRRRCGAAARARPRAGRRRAARRRSRSASTKRTRPGGASRRRCSIDTPSGRPTTHSSASSTCRNASTQHVHALVRPHRRRSTAPPGRSTAAQLGGQRLLVRLAGEVVEGAVGDHVHALAAAEQLRAVAGVHDHRVHPLAPAGGPRPRAGSRCASSARAGAPRGQQARVDRARAGSHWQCRTSAAAARRR